MIDRLNGLRHDAVVGCDDQHNNVGHVGAPRAHRSERGVTRRIDKRDFRPFVVNAICPYVLCNSANFACRYARLSNRVHERSFAMINVAHERDDGTAGLELLLLFNNRGRRRNHNLFDFVDAAAFFTALFFENKTVVLANLGRDVGLNCLIDIRENVETHQLRDELMRF